MVPVKKKEVVNFPKKYGQRKVEYDALYRFGKDKLLDPVTGGMEIAGT